jgi:hypothetical protein
MKTPRSFQASGLDALEDRVVLSQAHAVAAVAPFALHGQKAKVVAVDFARFQGAINSTVVPIVQNMNAAEKSRDYWRTSLDRDAVNAQVNNLVNGLGATLAKQLPQRMARIRTMITGAPAQTKVGLAWSTPSPGSLRATLDALPTDALTNPTVVGGIVSTYQSAMIAGNVAPRSRAAFVNFVSTVHKTVTPVVGQGQSQQQINAAIVSAVNTLGTQVATAMGPGAVADVQAKITGSAGSTGVELAATATPTAGSLAAILEAIPASEFEYNYNLIHDLALAYARTSTRF